MIDGSEAGEERRGSSGASSTRCSATARPPRCRRQVLLASFGEAYPRACGNCDNCLEPVADLGRDRRRAEGAVGCVYRTGQRFGAAHLIDVLRGDAQRARSCSSATTRLSTFGVGADSTRGSGGRVPAAGRAGPAAGRRRGHGGLRLTEASRDGAARRARRAAARSEAEPTRRARPRAAPARGADASRARPTPTRRCSRRCARCARAGARAERAGLRDLPRRHAARDGERSGRATLDELGAHHRRRRRKLERYGERMLAVLREAEAA